MIKTTMILCLVAFATNSFAQFGKKLTPEIITEFGTKEFSESKKKLFPIIKGVLETQGYEISIENLEKGIMKTKRKIIGVQDTGSGTFRAYVVNIEETGNTAKVVFTPKIFIGDADISEKKVWALKGVAGEEQLWKNLFKDIEDAL